jgi:hypothetical protein
MSTSSLTPSAFSNRGSDATWLNVFSFSKVDDCRDSKGFHESLAQQNWYSLRSILPFGNIDISRHILVLDTSVLTKSIWVGGSNMFSTLECFSFKLARPQDISRPLKVNFNFFESLYERAVGEQKHIVRSSFSHAN